MAGEVSDHPCDFGGHWMFVAPAKSKKVTFSTNLESGFYKISHRDIFVFFCPLNDCLSGNMARYKQNVGIPLKLNCCPCPKTGIIISI